MLRLFVVLALSAVAASADIAYDNITGNPGRITFLSEDEMADDTILDASAGLTIDRVEVGVRMLGSSPYAGSAILAIYASGPDRPGALLRSLSIPLSLSDNDQHLINFDFADFDIPDSRIWIGVRFTLRTNQTRVGFLDSNLPTIGATTDLRARHNPDATWGTSSIPNSAFLYRVYTVPAPAPAAALVFASLAGGLRRRR